LKLPAGFCATVFADGLGHARHLVVGSNGVVYVNTWSDENFGSKKPSTGAFLVALQDKSSSGKADVNQRFGETAEAGSKGGTGIWIYNGALYAEVNDRIVKYAMPSDGIVPTGSPETVVSGLPLGGDHPMHPFLIDSKGAMYVDVATATNSCQEKNRTLHSPGIDPCKELETRGGIWLYDANKTGQTFSPSDRYATGIRNGEGFAIDSEGNLYVTQHGRDQLHTNWPEIIKEPTQEATLPAEELMLLKKDGDYGWPYCYYDPTVNKLILAPEYGGDGKKTGLCDGKTGPAAVFAAHWGPNGAAHYDQKEFPERYQKGVFIAFHGSWNRAPYAQGGYNVVFQPLTGGKASGQCEVFADGFAGTTKSPDGAKYRPTGLAVGSDGAMYVSDDQSGRIYRITYKVGANAAAPKMMPCPSTAAPAGPVLKTSAQAPESGGPDAASALPAGVTKATIALGSKVYHGEVGGAGCTGCHGDAGKGTTIGPDLTGKKFLWSDGGFAGLMKTIQEGVAKPKNFRAPMPAMGGAQLTPAQVKAVTAYVWSLSHKAAK
jgi:glucose/arabinose dehydrogenase